ncbi:MAG: DMT family transporter [Muribaculaceae bacterium]|nr:DMT family transporter [Muribaculaceae bacterium]
MIELNKIKGYLLAAVAAAAYGTNPAFAIPLYEEGMNPNSVLLFRYVLGIPLLALMMIMRGQRFGLKGSDVFKLFVLGVLMALSSLTLFESYQYINSGVASTLLFVYPVIVAVMMIFFFNEKFKPSLVVCFGLMGAGLLLLMHTGGESQFSAYGFLLVMISALTYALYIVLINVTKSVATIPTTKLLFYMLIFGSMVFVTKMATGTALTLPTRPAGWLNLMALALIPTVLSLACTSGAIKQIGSTATAIFGALEPVVAVVLSVLLLGQGITGNEIIGGVLIILATTIVVAGNSVDNALLRVRKMFPSRRKRKY